MLKQYLFLGSISLGLVSLVGCDVDLSQSVQDAQELKNTVSNLNAQRTTVHHTVIVPGYGAPVKGNPSYENYIQTVADFVSDSNNAVNSVVFTGSYSSRKDLSEAEAMNSYFNSVVDITALQARGIRVYKEECAIVSWQNISNSQSLLTSQSITPNKVTVFGDINRKEKLYNFTLYKFNNLTDLSQAGLLNPLTKVEFQGFDFGGEQLSAEDQRTRFAAEIAGAYDPVTGNQILQQRITDWTTTYGYDVARNLVDKGCSEFKGFIK